jgi:hypothetical protein
VSFPSVNVFDFTSVFCFFSQVFSLVLKSCKVVGPEAFVFLHSSSWDASFSVVDNAAIDDFANFVWML